MIDTLLAIMFGVIVLGFSVIIILMVIFLGKLIWDYITDNF